MPPPNLFPNSFTLPAKASPTGLPIRLTWTDDLTEGNPVGGPDGNGYVSDLTYQWGGGVPAPISSGTVQIVLSPNLDDFFADGEDVLASWALGVMDGNGGVFITGYNNPLGTNLTWAGGDETFGSLSGIGDLADFSPAYVFTIVSTGVIMAYSSVGYNEVLTAAAITVQTGGYTTSQENTSFNYNNSLAIGSAAGEVDQIVDASGTVASSSTPTTVDLTTALNTQGVAAGMLHVVAIRFVNIDPTNTLTLKPAASQGVQFLPSAGIAVPPGGKFTLTVDQIPGGAAVAGLALTAGTYDTLAVATSGGTGVAFGLVIVGRDA